MSNHHCRLPVPSCCRESTAGTTTVRREAHRSTCKSMEPNGHRMRLSNREGRDITAKSAHGTTSGPQSNTCRRKRTTPANGGEGRGHRVSAPGVGLKSPGFFNRVKLTLRAFPCECAIATCIGKYLFCLTWPFFVPGPGTSAWSYPQGRVIRRRARHQQGQYPQQHRRLLRLGQTVIARSSALAFTKPFYWAASSTAAR